MIKRHDIYQWFKIEFGEMETVFKSMSDQELADAYGLRILRKGYFY